MHKKILIAYGTRPEVIKLAPVIHALKQLGHDPFIVNTGQQPQLSASAEAVFNIVPTSIHELNSRDLQWRFVDIHSEMNREFFRTNPSLVVVQGDTVSAMATALAGFNAGIPVAHVEAGLRTDNLKSPFPEEGYRTAIDSLSSFLFAPTQEAQYNVGGYHVGNTVLDAMNWLGSREISQNNKVLVTLHRREGIYKWEGVATAIKKLHQFRPELEFVLLSHPNPEVTWAHYRMVLEDAAARIESMSYLAFQKELRACRLIMSDSGGLQEEAIILGKPIVVLREHTERPEVLTTGVGRLSGFNTDQIVKDALELLGSRIIPAPHIYGTGDAGLKIARILLERTT